MQSRLWRFPVLSPITSPGPSAPVLGRVLNAILCRPRWSYGFLASISMDHRLSMTHPCLHLRDAHDAHVLFEAVRLKILPVVKRRLLVDEGGKLGHGNVFVWEETEDEGGILRWTDGRRWSPSRIKGDYLYYEETVAMTAEERRDKAARRAQRIANPSFHMLSTSRREDRLSRPGGLIKQSYSTFVKFPNGSEPKKWHVVAYFRSEDCAQLPVIDDLEYFRDIRVPDDVYRTGKLPRRNSQTPRSSPGKDDSFFPPRSSIVLPPASLPPTSPALLPSLSILILEGQLPLYRFYVRADRKDKAYNVLTSEDRRALEKLRVSSRLLP